MHALARAGARLAIFLLLAIAATASAQEAAPAGPSGPSASPSTSPAPIEPAAPSAPATPSTPADAAPAAAAPAPPGTAAPAPAPDLANAELGAFLDGLIEGLMAERHVPGAVALLVRDGRVVYEKGYGVADPATGRLVDPEETLFRVASVSKLVTATAVMQLVEQGKLDLDADANQYLEGFAVVNRFGKPVTLTHLLTHTGGFDDSFLRSTQELGETPVPLGEYLAKRMPPQVMPPGDHISYSNHGLALAGYIVERVSGQPFAEYVQEHILRPLGMTRSGFGLPWPLPPDVAVGTNWKNDRYEPSGYDRLLMGPAGDLYTSAGDMARFMLAHLADGRIPPEPGAEEAPFGDAPPPPRILREDTARTMHARHFTHHPKLTGWALGFEEGSRNGVPTIEHGGSWRGFGTALVLVPEKQLGLFVSTTRSADARFFVPLLRAFFDRVLPRATPLVLPQGTADFAERVGRYTGTYLPNRHVRGDFLKLGLFQSEARVTANDDGTLTFHWPGGVLDPTRLVEVGPDLFQREGDGHFVAFRMGADGRATHLFSDAFALDRVPWWERPTLHGVAAIACVLLFLATVVGYPLGGLVRRVFGGPSSGVPRGARVLAVLVSLLELGFLVGIGAGLALYDPFQLFGKIPLWLTGLSLLPFAALPLSLGLPIALARSGWSRSWTPLERVHFLLLTLAAGYFAYFCWYWKLLGVIR